MIRGDGWHGRLARLAHMENETVTSDDTATESTVLVEDELLVEEISIDGMCGVY
jgi:mycofactocin precursor